MAFMRPEYTNEPFLTGETPYGEGDACPLSAWITLASRNDPDAQRVAMDRYAEDRKLDRESVEIVHGKWWVRLSAHGYMDCTDWSGPYASEALARKAISDLYDCDPDTGDSDEDVSP